MHAAWQALQPMQRLTSISFATSRLRAHLRRDLGGGGAADDVERLEIGHVRSPSGHRDRGLLDVHQERLEFRGFRIGVADERGQHVGAEALDAPRR